MKDNLYDDFQQSVINIVMCALVNFLKKLEPQQKEPLPSWAKDDSSIIFPSAWFDKNPPNFDNLIIQEKENADFKAAMPIQKEETQEMPPIYDDIKTRPRGKSGLLEYRFSHKGKQLSAYGYSNKECWEDRDNIIAGKKKKKAKTTQKQKSSHTVGEWFVLFYRTNKIRKDGTKINPANEVYINDVICKWWQDLPLKALTGLEIKERLKEYDDRTNARKKIYTLINEGLENAVDNQLVTGLKYNPCRAVKLERHIVEPYPVIHPADHNRILAAIKEPKYAVLFWYLCCSGLRLDAAIKSIEGIDLENHVINVLKKSSSTKKNCKRIPFLPSLFDESKLELLKQVTYSGAEQYFRELFRDLGVDAVIHSCRKTFASCAHHVGFNDKQIQNWMAHGTISMTMNTYVVLIEGSSPIVDYFKALKKYLKTKKIP